MDTEVVLIFFFFQAEDGIRDLTVTGVQTCALPICRPMIALGVPAGTSNPNHDVISKSGRPASDIVGTSGSRVARLGTVTASALTFPALICDPISATLENIIETSPPRRPAIPGPEPL